MFRSGRTTARAARLPLVLISVLLAAVAVAAPAQAAAPHRSINPFVNCYWDNGNGTVTVSVGYRSTNSGSVTEPIGTANRFSPGAQNRGQPTTFLPGTQNNAFAVTVSYAEIGNQVNWYVTGNSVNVQSVTKCATKPVPQVGNVGALLLGFLALGLVALVVVSGRTRPRVAVA